MLEETGIPYEVHKVDFAKNDQKTFEYLSLNENGKIPSLLDPDGPGGQPLALAESGAILIYLADKAGRFLSKDPALKIQTIQWVMFQLSGIGPMFGQVGFFHHFAGKDWEDKRPLQRYVDESKRLLGVLDHRLKGREWIMGEYSIADISTFPWINNLIGLYAAGDLVGIQNFPETQRVLTRFLARSAVQRGLNIPSRS